LVGDFDNDGDPDIYTANHGADIYPSPLRSEIGLYGVELKILMGMEP